MSNEPKDSFYGKAVLFCAHHVKERGLYGAVRSFVWHPMNRYEGTEMRGDINGPLLMVNCNVNKGGNQLIELAKRMPHKRFIVVLGAYDRQIMDESLPNVSYMPSTNNMAQYYQNSSALLILSHKEGSPTVAQEAMSFGLPVISFNLDGVREVCGGSGIYCNNLHEVQKAIETKPDFITPPVIERDYEGLKKFFTV